LAKGDIARLIISYAKEILSITSIIFARWPHALCSWSWGAFGTYILGNGRSLTAARKIPHLGSNHKTKFLNDADFIVRLLCKHSYWSIFQS